MNNNKSIKLNLFFNLIKQASTILFPIISFAYVSRVLSVEGIGKVDFSKSIVSYFSMFAILGITTYGVREATKLRDNKEQLGKLVYELLAINAITTVTTYVIFYAVVVLVPKFHEYTILLLISSVSIAFTALGLEWLYSALEEFRYIAVRTLIFQGVSLILLFLLVKKPEDYYNYCGILVLSTVGSNLLNFIHARKYIKKPVGVKLNLRVHIKPILVFFANTIAGNIYVTLDTSMVGILSNDYSVGLYSAANKMNRLMLSIIGSISVVLLPRLTYYLQKGALDKYKDITRKSIECVCMIGLPLSVGMYMLSEDIILLFSGSDFVPAGTCAKIMSMIIIFIPLSSAINSSIIIPHGKEKYQLISTIIGAVTNLTLNSILIPRFQEIGAAIGTAISELAVCISLIAFGFCVMDYRFAFRCVYHYLVATIVMGFIIGFVVNFLDMGLIRIVVVTVLGMISYAMVLFIYKDEFFLYTCNSLKRIVN